MASGKLGKDPRDVGKGPLDICTLLDKKYGIQGHGLDSRPKAGRIAVSKVAIIGAGISGLYTAMILQSLDIPHKIIEATNRTGGRIMTHKFPGDPADPGDPAQYYDVGAMRFPLGLPIMARLLRLFEHADIAPNIALIPYNFVSVDNMHYLHYNGVRTRKSGILDVPLDDHFGFGVAEAYHSVGYERIVRDVRTAYVAELEAHPQNGEGPGWDFLMARDRYSTRAYMSVAYSPNQQFLFPDLLDANGLPANAPLAPGLPAPGLPNDVINWCETMDGSTGDYDRAFSQTVLGAMAFGAVDPAPLDAGWRCIEGGSSRITDAMVAALGPLTPIDFNTPVNAIGLTNPDLGRNSMMTVNSFGGEPEQFSHVVSTIPLPVLRSLDLSRSSLTLHQGLALRQLRYGHAVKIGVQFQTAWWTHGIDRDGLPVGIVGGQSSTDMPIRTVVYPSYGLDRPDTEPAVLIASYCWTEDAERFAALIVQFNSTPNPLNSPLAELVLRNLAELHNVEVGFLAAQVMAIHPWDWNAAPYAMGASARFGPSDFAELHHLFRPAAEGRLHFAGDAISTRHAWTVGALDSAWRAVDDILFNADYPDDVWAEKRTAFRNQWGRNVQWD
ncbi:FAD/NAD(P)-binding domain-containing protein [Athelia psychrophila]|uniref:FAD/NAD(P)-binding domain-containing protein n=1 Tax=Athelia psychrophila TaxID=1759441 RepID=A0A166MY52_9AGAM|nr:FAD/NAD(P)-binding domain-containing protein [Fibularhizoctonia sp. CBS 109695]